MAANSNMAAFALDGGDPRMSMGEGQVAVPAAVRRKLHDPSILLEEYFHYAKLQRAAEKAGLDPAQREAIANGSEQPPTLSGGSPGEKGDSSDEKKGDLDVAIPHTGDVVSPAEWEAASRAVRNASWGSIVYLITTDILGPSNAPFAISQYGYVGGTLIYTCMGIAAFFAGWQIWRMFLALDSDKYPMRTFGDLGFRIYGTWTRHGMNVLQSLQLLFNVGVIIIVNGVSLSQMSKFRLCFTVCVLIWPLCGFVLGQIRTLAKFGHLANFSIWLNVLVIVMTMGVACHSLPNYTATPYNGPIEHTVWIPSGSTFDTQLNAAMQIVYAYGGAMLYCEFMSEMKRPFDFIKAQFVAECFIFICYLVFGLVVYSQQGQYTYNPANQGLSPYSWQTVTNALGLVSGLIAAALYGNIGLKVIYQNIVQDLMGGPELVTRQGKILWAVMIPVYWAVAFVIASAVPQFTNISSMVAAVCILQFTYTFPTILYFGMLMQEDAMHPDDHFDPATNTTHRVDTWRSWARWKRGLFTGHVILKAICFLFFLASLATAALGMYASGTALQESFQEGHSTSFSCRSPADMS